MLQRWIYLLQMCILVGCFPPLKQLQGFGTQQNFEFGDQQIAENQLDIINLIDSRSNNIYIKIRSKRSEQIQLTKNIVISNKKNVCIEGPIILRNYGIYVQNNSQNIILYNIRLINSSIYGVLVKQSINVVIDHLTILNSSRQSVEKGKCIDITQDSHNITISNSIIGYFQPQYLVKYKGMLIANFLYPACTNISIHHNIFYKNYQRSPQISTNGLIDFRNNIIYCYQEYGSRFRQYCYGNILNNYYIGGKKDPIIIINSTQPLNYLYVRDNMWKYQLDKWVQIQNQGEQEYKVPAVKTMTFDVLIEIIQTWGCSVKEREQIIILNQIKDNSHVTDQKLGNS